MDARSVKTRHGDGWTGYGVMLDVFPDIFAYGELLVPDDTQAEEKRPEVVCQHGLEGRPQDAIVGNHRAYYNFAAELTPQGFIVLAPQNPYIGGDEWALHHVGKSKAFGVSTKHRGAMAMEAHAGKAFWFLKAAGELVTSRYYYEDYPEWVVRWNARRPTLDFGNQSWESMKMSGWNMRLSCFPRITVHPKCQDTCSKWGLKPITSFRPNSTGRRRFRP